ncbi:AraC family transcriptional regulator [Sphingomonas glacialis]|uniref:AraC family transcriptional regulator n=1 Tax=Sphingomonas glacialis TaxID=658225 RepID=A0A502FAX6_9SPHN|nr:AraC family transcriptional regulator [Sphingomonas glacialis]TPG46537.1 AraC family transcriptional regulator [Sphingomonas glacialis]
MAMLTGRTWAGVAIDQLSAYTVSEMAVGPRDHHLLAINLADHPYVRAKRCGRVYESAGRLGEAAIIPAGEASTWDGNVPAHVTVRIPASAIIEMASDVLPMGTPHQAIANNFRIRDPFIANMAAIFSLEISRAPHPAQDVLVESLVTALLLHLLRGYTGVPWRDEQPLRNVAPAALHRALAYIEDQPGVRVSLGDLAAVAGLSRFHFSRLFRRYVGMPPALYVERSRIERAKAMICIGQLSLADIAYAVGFADQSHFTRRFRHHEGRTPSDYQRDHAWQRHPRRKI